MSEKYNKGQQKKPQSKLISLKPLYQTMWKNLRLRCPNDEVLTLTDGPPSPPHRQSSSTVAVFCCLKQQFSQKYSSTINRKLDLWEKNRDTGFYTDDVTTICMHPRCKICKIEKWCGFNFGFVVSPGWLKADNISHRWWKIKRTVSEARLVCFRYKSCVMCWSRGARGRKQQQQKKKPVMVTNCLLSCSAAAN